MVLDVQDKFIILFVYFFNYSCYMRKVVLITGGLGFIGSHLCVELINKDYYLIIIDNYQYISATPSTYP